MNLKAIPDRGWAPAGVAVTHMLLCVAVSRTPRRHGKPQHAGTFFPGVRPPQPSRPPWASDGGPHASS